jgi:N-acetylmuramoyl-L-alanine amidase
MRLGAARRILGAMAGVAAGFCVYASSDPPAVVRVRHWSLGDLTRISIESTGGFEYRSEQIEDPLRLFFDVQGARNGLSLKGVHVIPVGDNRVRQIRVAENSPSVTRVVLDLEKKVEFTAEVMTGPDRLVVEVRAAEGGVPGTPPAVVPAARKPAREFVSPPQRPSPKPGMLIAIAGPATAAVPGVPQRTLMTRVLGTPLFPGPPGAAMPAPKAPAATALVSPPPSPAAAPPDKPAPAGAARTAPAASAPAKRPANGRSSMTRALGLKVRKVVIDPGHGGHDFGTTGPTGLHEKDLVLDIATRLGSLIEEKLGSEVIYTRTDDTFVGLEDRTRLANEHRADLFISVHANSSPARSATGVETYYLSFTTSREAMEVAARENASSDRSVHELRDLLQKIALADKVNESREFATMVQAALHSTSSKALKGSRNRGVKKAPFVVLIGASMPSILAEIGFVSNSREESLMKKPEHRQKIAEALLKGVQQYSNALSHDQVAQREE